LGFLPSIEIQRADIPRSILCKNETKELELPCLKKTIKEAEIKYFLSALQNVVYTFFPGVRIGEFSEVLAAKY